MARRHSLAISCKAGGAGRSAAASCASAFLSTYLRCFIVSGFPSMVDSDSVPFVPDDHEVAESVAGGGAAEPPGCRGLLDTDGSFALQRSETPAIGSASMHRVKSLVASWHYSVGDRAGGALGRNSIANNELGRASDGHHPVYVGQIPIFGPVCFCST